MTAYVIYYVFNLFVNSNLLNVYVIFVFREQASCLDQDSDISDSITVALLSGFTVVVIDMINQTLIHCYLRFKVEEKESMIVHCMYAISNSSVWILRVVIICVSFTQGLTISNNRKAVCFEKPDGLLLGERKALIFLISTQVIKVLVFSNWDFLLTKPIIEDYS